MTSAFTLTVTVLVPEALAPLANELAKIIKANPDTPDTFYDFSWEDEDGNRYAAGCFAAEETFIGIEQHDLPATPGVGMAQAIAAQDSLVSWKKWEDEPLLAHPDDILICFDKAPGNGREALAQMGVTRVQQQPNGG